MDYSKELTDCCSLYLFLLTYSNLKDFIINILFLLKSIVYNIKLFKTFIKS